MITRRDRIYAALNGEVLDRIPTGFWMHFPDNAFFGEAAVNAHLEYFEKTKTDMCKVMTEHIYPCLHDINSAKDWEHIEIYNEDAPFIREQADIVREIVKKVPDASIVGTIHGTVASGSHTLLGIPRYDGIGRHAMIYHLRTNPESLGKAFQRISDSLCCMVRAQIKAGAEGIYYAALGGESDVFTDEEHKEFVAPCDKKVIDAAYDAGAKYVILHMCKSHVRLERFATYKCDVVNWGIEESGVSLKDARKIFPDKVLLGGFNNRHGSLINGDSNEIKDAINGMIESVGNKKFILGSDCTLPSDLPYENIRKVVEASESIGISR